MAVYDQNRWVMAHIPPAREDGRELIATSAQVIQEYEQAMTTRFTSARMQSPQGYLLMSNMLGAAEQQTMRQWFQQNNVPVTVKIYSPNDVITGSGNLVFSREAQVWPPSISFL
jgi:hypothetical protein